MVSTGESGIAASISVGWLSTLHFELNNPMMDDQMAWKKRTKAAKIDMVSNKRRNVKNQSNDDEDLLCQSSFVFIMSFPVG